MLSIENNHGNAELRANSPQSLLNCSKAFNQHIYGQLIFSRLAVNSVQIHFTDFISLIKSVTFSRCVAKISDLSSKLNITECVCGLYTNRIWLSLCNNQYVFLTFGFHHNVHNNAVSSGGKFNIAEQKNGSVLTKTIHNQNSHITVARDERLRY